MASGNAVRAFLVRIFSIKVQIPSYHGGQGMRSASYEYICRLELEICQKSGEFQVLLLSLSLMNNLILLMRFLHLPMYYLHSALSTLLIHSIFYYVIGMPRHHHGCLHSLY